MPAMNVTITSKRHREWQANHTRWKWLLDSLEGGEAYRWASYGIDFRQLPIRNLFRHKSEYPDPRDPNSAAAMVNAASINPRAYSTDDDYTLRLMRTPVPSFLEEVVEIHLSKIFAREPIRTSTSQQVQEWWEDVDGTGMTIKQWMAEVVGPLLLALGCLDIVVDHPPAPKDATIRTRQDQADAGLNAIVAGIILPENMVDWDLDQAGRYTRCVVMEATDAAEITYREWQGNQWVLYSEGGDQIDQGEHQYGQPPIRRIFDRKRSRFRNIGKPRYETISELQQEYYNRDSELILSDTQQAHPLVQGPEEYCKADGEIPVSISRLLPMKRAGSMGQSVSYQGFEIIGYPKDGAESIRQNLQLIRDKVDRAACLTKPAGAAGTTSGAVSQSGLSKQMDQTTGHDLLAKLSAMLGRVELEILDLVLLVAGDGKVDQAALDATTVAYPKTFELTSAEELATGITDFQAILDAAGPCPETQLELLKRLVRLLNPGRDDEAYAEMDQEIEDFLDQKAEASAQAREALALTTTSSDEDGNGDREPGPAAGTAGPDAPDESGTVGFVSSVADTNAAITASPS